MAKSVSPKLLLFPELEIKALKTDLKMYLGNTFWRWSIDTELDFDSVGS